MPKVPQVQGAVRSMLRGVQVLCGGGRIARGARAALMQLTLRSRACLTTCSEYHWRALRRRIETISELRDLKVSREDRPQRDRG